MTPSLTETVKRLRELAAKAFKAAPGEWESDTCHDVDTGGYGEVIFQRHGPMGKVARVADTFNADYLLTPEEREAICDHIAAANPQAITEVLAELERLTGERDHFDKQWNTALSIAAKYLERAEAAEAKVATLERQLAEAPRRTPGTVEVCPRYGSPTLDPAHGCWWSDYASCENKDCPIKRAQSPEVKETE